MSPAEPSGQGERNQSPSKSAASPTKANAAVNSQSPAKSPTKPKASGKNATWDALWQFGINLESGVKKKS
jgi:hypothetical protein